MFDTQIIIYKPDTLRQRVVYARIILPNREAFIPVLSGVIPLLCCRYINNLMDYARSGVHVCFVLDK